LITALTCQIPTVYPKDQAPSTTPPLLQTIYDNQPVAEWELFDVVRQRVNREWHRLPKTAQVLSPALRDKIAAFKPNQ
jgi:hypothetical protein